MRERIRIATVFEAGSLEVFTPLIMTTIRWARMSEALADLGYDVDMIVDAKSSTIRRHPHLRLVPFSRVDWSSYDVVKTLFHAGFSTLATHGGADHPFIIAKLGSVVGGRDGVEGVHFSGAEREALFEMQRQIDRKSRYVTVLTEPSRMLWEAEFGGGDRILTVPTGVDREIPPPRVNPYRGFGERIAVYIGTLYRSTQREINLLWQHKLNRLGARLKKKGIRLCVVGRGMTDQLDRDAVTFLGEVENDRVWDYQYFAHTGVVLAQGAAQHNESSKIYYYLRSGLPVVSEAPIPNNDLIRAAGLGYVCEYGDEETMAEMIDAASRRSWGRDAAIALVLDRHTWHDRAGVYDALLQAQLGRRALT
jgi:glycosyltransferase involved in cell wall biosynthesis